MNDWAVSVSSEMEGWNIGVTVVSKLLSKEFSIFVPSALFSSFHRFYRGFLNENVTYRCHGYRYMTFLYTTRGAGPLGPSDEDVFRLCLTFDSVHSAQ